MFFSRDHAENEVEKLVPDLFVFLEKVLFRTIHLDVHTEGGGSLQYVTLIPLFWNNRSVFIFADGGIGVVYRLVSVYFDSPQLGIQQREPV